MGGCAWRHKHVSLSFSEAINLALFLPLLSSSSHIDSEPNDDNKGVLAASPDGVAGGGGGGGREG